MVPYVPPFFNFRWLVGSWCYLNIYIGILCICEWQWESQVKIFFYKVPTSFECFSWVLHSQDQENDYYFSAAFTLVLMCCHNLWILGNLWHLVSSTNHYLDMCLFLDIYTLSHTNYPRQTKVLHRQVPQ